MSDSAVTAPARSNAPRLHYLDAARAALMLLGIPYHAAQPYTDRAWFISSVSGSETVAFIGNYLHLFRMHAFYVIAGFFAAMILSRRGPAIWIKDRARRLLIPLLFAVVVILPIMFLALDLEQGRGIAGWIDHMQTEPSFWIAHTWFLRDLFLYCVGLCIIDIIWGIRERDVSTARMQIILILTFILISSLYVYAVRTTLTLYVHFGDDQLIRFFYYIPFFLAGVVLWMIPSGFANFRRWSAPGAIMAALWLFMATLLGARDDVGTLPAAMISILNGFVGTWLAVTLAHRFLDRPSPRVMMLVDGSLTIYLIHLAIVLIVGPVLIGSLKMPLVEWGLIAVSALLGSFIVYRIARHLPMLYYAMNGQRPPKRAGE